MSESLRTIRLQAASLNAESFARFGRLPVDEGDPGDLADLEFLWNDAHLNYICHTGDEVGYDSGEPFCELLNRHDTHTQVLMPVDADAVLVVAPPEAEFTRPEYLESVEAFLVRRYQCLALHRGTWHWGPYPLEVTGSVRLLNVQGCRYREDNGIAWLARDHGVRYSVTIHSSFRRSASSSSPCGPPSITGDDGSSTST